MDIERQEWLTHNATQKAQKAAMSRRNKMLQELLGACAVSTDPKVTALYGQYLELAATIAVFSPEKEDK